MSILGAMKTYALSKVQDAIDDDVTLSRLEEAAEAVKEELLPFCMIFGGVQESSLVDYRQNEEVSAFSMIYIEKFGDDVDGPSLMDARYEAIKAEILAGNALDTDVTGFFAALSSASTNVTEKKARRAYIGMEILFLTTDVADSNFSLVE